jgi:ABC-2 type transport system ATP-binding protein
MIKTNKIRKEFDGFTALSEVCCTIPKGCIYGMVGSNGAGKSTFLRLLTGVYKPDAGNITIDDMPVYENPEMKSKITFVPDELYFIQGAHMNRMADFYRSVYDNFDKERYRYLTDAFGLNAVKSLNTFSKGMRRQAAIILALSCKPEYMFFDETFDGLDPVMRNLVKGLICKDVIENKATAIITSHSLRELEDICDQLALLHKGGVVLESDIDHLRTSQFKIQIAFNYDYTEELFQGIEIHNIKKTGSVTNMIVKGSREATVKRLEVLNPILLEILPLTLEEVFTYEMEALGYHFEDVLEV